jgi:hypothetical protein
MGQTMHKLIVSVVCCAAAVGCGGGSPSGDGGSNGDMPAGVDMASGPPTFKSSPIPGCKQGGTQTVLVTQGQKVAIATIDEPTPLCDPTNGGPNCTACMIPMRATSYVQNYDICYAESTGGAFTTSIAATSDYIALLGVGMALDPSGNPVVAFNGGGPAARRCGATELMLTTGSGGTFGAPQTIAMNSMSAGVVPDQMAACIQNVCNSGDCTGYWPAIAIDSGGVQAIAWRDLHYGTAMTDFDSSDVEFAQSPGYSDLTVDVSRGGGSYMRIAYTPSGKVAIVHYNESDQGAGIWINHQLPSGTWEAVHIVTGKVGEQLGFGVSPGGLHAVAYYNPTLLKLQYVESMDGTTWTAPVDVDTDGNTGEYPSLAIDAAGEPEIAYYRCGDYSPTNQNCDMGKDGLKLARREGGRWRTYDVSKDTSMFDGIYPAIGFVDGKAVIAYQTKVFDPGSNTSTLTLNVARQQ